MRVTWILMGVALAAGAAAPAAAMSSGKNAKPRILSATVAGEAAQEVSVKLVGRDRDDVVRGAEISWGDGQPKQGLSACELSSSRRADEARRGKKERFELFYAYPDAGHYTITVRVSSGGCGKRPLQRSAARRLTVHVE